MVMGTKASWLYKKKLSSLHVSGAYNNSQILYHHEHAHYERAHGDPDSGSRFDVHLEREPG